MHPFKRTVLHVVSACEEESTVTTLPAWDAESMITVILVQWEELEYHQRLFALLWLLLWYVRWNLTV